MKRFLSTLSLLVLSMFNIVLTVVYATELDESISSWFYGTWLFQDSWVDLMNLMWIDDVDAIWVWTWVLTWDFWLNWAIDGNDLNDKFDSWFNFLNEPWEQENSENLDDIDINSEVLNSKSVNLNVKLLGKSDEIKVLGATPDIVYHDVNANITYVDTNWKEFNWIWTITFNDGVHQVTILDRNLWAESAWTWVDSYWYQFQWWNNHGFKSCSQVNCQTFPWWENTMSAQVDISWYGWNRPYISSQFVTDFEKRNQWNNGLWDSENQIKRQWPCPAGYHIPTVYEWNDLVKNMLAYYTWNWLLPSNTEPTIEWLWYWVVAWGGKASILSNDLLIPYAMMRDKSWKIVDGNWSYFWTTSKLWDAKLYTFKSAPDWFWTTKVVRDNVYWDALSLRCFKDTYAEEDKPLILEYETDWWTKIQSQTIPSWEKAFLPWYTTHKSWAIFQWWYSDNSYTTKYELDSNNPYQFSDLIMNEDLADENGVVKIYAKWQDIIEYDADAWVTYIDTNWKEFNWIWTITFNDGVHQVTILDRNLWAELTWYSMWDSNWNNVNDWYNFQWWNNYWFKSCSDVDCESFPWWEGTWDIIVDISWYSWDNPYVNSWFIVNGSWMRSSSNNNSLWNNENQVKRQWPCPAGYHIPTVREMNDLLRYWIYTYTWQWWTFPSWWWVEMSGNLYWVYWDPTLVKKDFWLRFSWFRGKNWKMEWRWDWTVLWSTTPFNEERVHTFKVRYGWFGVTYDDQLDISRADAAFIRCFKDDYSEWDEPLILEYETNWGTKIQSQTIPFWNNGFLPWYTTYKSWAQLLWWFNDEWTQQYEFETGKYIFTNLIMNDNMKIYAKWWYNIVFQDEIGNEIWNIVVAEWSKITIPESLFQTWHTLTLYDEMWNVFDVENNVISWDIRLIVKNTINQYTITFDTDWWNNIDPITADYGTEIYVSNPVRNWYIFKWWNPKLPSKMPAENLLVKAIWNKIWYSWKWKTEWKSGIDDYWSAGEGWDIENWWDDMWWETNNNSLWWYSVEFQNAFKFAKENWITTKDSIQSADMTWKLTRIQMAKMLSQYAINVLWQMPDVTRTINFVDVSPEKDLSYDNWVTLSYQLWIMWQNMMDNKFRPDDEVTRWEFVTSLSRLLFSTIDWEFENTPMYYVHHIEKLKEEWIITIVDPKMKERRWYVMIMLMRSKLD